jgi:hypothetical protein
MLRKRSTIGMPLGIAMGGSFARKEDYILSPARARRRRRS